MSAPGLPSALPPAPQPVPPLAWPLRWPFGELTVQALGGMLAPLTFFLPGGKTVSPLHVAPWADSADANDPPWPGILRRLRGEWPCVPFGASQPPAGLPEGWSGHAADDAWDHGFASNHDWQLVTQTASEIVLRMNCPQSSAVDYLLRSIRPRMNEAAIDVELTVHARRATQLPMALHPTFKVPPTGVHISAQAERVYSYPVPAEPGVSRLVPNTSGPSLSAMPILSGVGDFSQLPLPHKTEELLQLHHCQPPLKLHYLEDQAEVQLDWNSAVLPDAMVWISNGGRSQPPWSGRHYALGLEPVCGFFDLGRVVDAHGLHPLAANRGVTLVPGQPLVVAYSISAMPSDAAPSQANLA